MWTMSGVFARSMSAATILPCGLNQSALTNAIAPLRDVCEVASHRRAAIFAEPVAGCGGRVYHPRFGIA